MKHFLLLITLTLASFSILTATAEAKRMGGGGNIGKQRTISPQQAKTPTTSPAPTAPAAGNKWLGPLAGLAIGAGLGAMFAGGGLGGAMGGILMALLAAGLVMFLVSRFRKSQVQQPAMQYTGSGTSSYQPASSQQPFAGAGGNAVPPAPQTSSIPADFPVEAFLRSAKTSFIRLQAANDRKDVNDIREYTTPEMFAEISLQLQERGDVQQKTDVQSINTQIIEVVNEGDYAIASVRMSGQLSENNGIPESFNEIWHVQKNLRDEKAVWLLSGIQQVT